ncbi:ribonuclease [Dermochelys coriacea]|uniref:ribonuclease n=1 Tax=Dermochelys coriacea TaxID=27794 RepID=UPI001CAA092A|nr:ribonuclease [Dermochelys coriacea]
MTPEGEGDSEIQLCWQLDPSLTGAQELGRASSRGIMAQRGPYPTLLLVLLAAWLALARGETYYKKFLRQHVDYPRTAILDARTYCNQMMQRRGMTSPVCKFTNTFVHASTDSITTICGPGGTPVSGNLRDSTASFAITTCRLQGGSQRPPCNYNGGTSTQRIHITCEGELPVHYDRAI